jgi:cbb3-type cytochrome oxidase subunit 3
VLGMPLPWVLLGFAVYPFFVCVGWFYLRAAERNERDFADVVNRS